MPSLPDSEIYLLIRTYFGDDAAWDELRTAIDEGSQEGFFATVEYVDDRQFDRFSVEALEAAHPHRADAWDVMYVADERAIIERAHPLLVVRVGCSDDQPFRCRADLLYEVDANLSLANLDWDDFRDQIDESGVYGGVEVVTGQQPQAPTDPALAAYHSASGAPITISLPTVPSNLWAMIFNDLWEAPAEAFGVGYKEVGAISMQIVDRDQPALRRLGDDAVITLPAKEWAFIRERARQLQATHTPGHDDGRPHGAVAGQIVELISRQTP